MSDRKRKKFRVRLNDDSPRPSPKPNYNGKSRVLSPERTAAYTGLSKITLAKLRGSGEGPSFYKLTAGKYGRVGYRIADLDAWLETRRRQSTSEDDFLRGRRRRDV